MFHLPIRECTDELEVLTTRDHVSNRVVVTNLLIQSIVHISDISDLYRLLNDSSK